MVRRLSGRPGFARRPNLALATAFGAFVAQACGLGSEPAPAGSGGSSGSSSSAGADVAGSGGKGGFVLPTAGTAGSDPCATPAPLFEDQVVRDVGPQRIFYSWTTAEQVAELRAGEALFSRSERPGEGRGLLFTELERYAATGDAAPQQLAALLGTQLFAKARYAWPNPWATLLGFPGESYGDQLLRIELKAEAWIAYFDADVLRVFDANGEPVTVAAALANPERIGAIYHESQAEAGSAHCGTFAQGGVGYREFALGNLQMVARWSLDTAEIRQRLQADVAELERFQEALPCVRPGDQAAWADGVKCEWGRAPSGLGLLSSYGLALGLPSELYWPSTENVAALIAAVEASLPSGEPLEVELGD